MNRGLKNSLPLLVLLLTSGCGSDTITQSSTGATSTETNVTTTASSQITWTCTPSPAVAVVSTDANYSYSTTFTLNLTESKGVGVKILSLKGLLQQGANGIVITPPTGFTESYRYSVSAPSNRVEGNGTLTLGFTFFYTLPNTGKEALVTMTLSVIDDSGNSATVTATENVS